MAQQQKNQQLSQDPIIQMQQAELQIKQQEAQTRAQKTQADIQLNQQKLQLEQARVAADLQKEGTRVTAQERQADKKMRLEAVKHMTTPRGNK
jgi:hypothetical protein